MHQFRLIFLMLAAAVVFAHSVSPHHHHVDQEIAENNNYDHDDDHHHHTHDHHQSDDHAHNIFTFSQIDEVFLTVKYVFKPIDTVPLTVLLEWSTSHNLLREPEEFFIQDSERPPLIRWCAISFRGPPTV